MSEGVLTLKSHGGRWVCQANECCLALTSCIPALCSGSVTEKGRKIHICLHLAGIMASTSNSSASSRASPLSLFDKEALVDLIKEHFDVLNDKSTKFYASNKKAQAWQEISRKFCDSTGHQKIACSYARYGRTSKLEARMITPGTRLRGLRQEVVSHQSLCIFSHKVSFLCWTMNWTHYATHGTVITDTTQLLLKMKLEDPVQEEIPHQVPHGSPAALAQPVLHNGPGVPPQPVLHNSPGVPPQPVLHSSPTGTVEQPVTPRPRKGHLVKKKLVQDAKQRALKLAEERHQ
ncbi:uncharacterized protein LOC123499962 [Portunus trituberculatus]|uniref:uncharacterized protein LOC123499962 n=1 Tax=Portunus trituberculatus TaxID=210409 RepID=UPI001E1D0495|nr:uncharacterized protein LOC123499962 [Portunus trituberculatus]